MLTSCQDDIKQLKTMLCDFTEDMLTDFYQRGLKVKGKIAKRILDKTVKDVCEIKGYDFMKVKGHA